MVILLDDLHDDGAVALGRFLEDFVLHAVAVKRRLVVLDLVRNLPESLVVRKLLLEHEVEGLADAGGLDALHGFVSFWPFGPC